MFADSLGKLRPHQPDGAEQPLSLVLFDEVEKAHPKLWNLLLGILEDGNLILGNNEEVDFTRSIIVLTTNVGSKSMGVHLERGRNLRRRPGDHCAEPQGTDGKGQQHQSRRQAIRDELPPRDGERQPIDVPSPVIRAPGRRGEEHTERCGQQRVHRGPAGHTVQHLPYHETTRRGVVERLNGEDGYRKRHHHGRHQQEP